MATSLPTFNESTSSKPSTLQGPNEYTSLLGSNRENDATGTPAAGQSASQPHEQDAPRPINEEATGAFEPTRGKTDPKLATGIFGLISVLLLGMIFSTCTLLRGGVPYSHPLAGYRLLHCQRRRLDYSRNIQYDLFRTR